MTSPPNLNSGDSKSLLPSNLTISPSLISSLSPNSLKLINIAIIVGSLLTGCIINAIGFLMYWWKRGFMVELYLCTVVMVVFMIAACLEQILLELMNLIYSK